MSDINLERLLGRDRIPTTSQAPSNSPKTEKAAENTGSNGGNAQTTQEKRNDTSTGKQIILFFYTFVGYKQNHNITLVIVELARQRYLARKAAQGKK